MISDLKWHLMLGKDASKVCVLCKEILDPAFHYIVYSRSDYDNKQKYAVCTTIKYSELPYRCSIMSNREAVNHPAHYGGESDPYEAIKVIEAWSLGFCLGNAVKYISRAGKKDPTKTIEDLKKSRWYLDREIARLESSK